MVKTIYSAEQFRDEFIGYGRGNQFSPAGFRGLWEYLEEAGGDEFNLDVIGLCVDFTEYENLAEAVEQYYDAEDYSDEEGMEQCMDDLRDSTLVIELDNGGVILANH
jgi:hypothetical protein